jgi:uncharacterized protein (TIGR00375 family)
MKFFADLHIHSRYSRATSKQLDLEHCHAWARRKGVTVMGTGDCIHPQWLDEITEKLEPAEEGLFRLPPRRRTAANDHLPDSCAARVRFALTTEISTIYKRDGRVRKVHSLIMLPSLDAARKLQSRLDAVGNIASDGRPILGLDTRDLLAMTLECGAGACLIPAHIWTPWFSLLGSKSGFDHIEECFGDLTTHIFAVETGLSSDPPMNWRLSQLDPYALVSSSDAHSAAKLGREATVFDTALSYRAMLDALRDPAGAGLLGTVEFFPEEGKYHYDGHRKCESRMRPEETIAHDGACPVCGKPATVGVMARVVQLADRPPGRRSPRAKPYWSFIPLAEIVAEACQTGAGSRRVSRLVEHVQRELGSEFFILADAPIDAIERAAGELVAEGVRRMRAGEVRIDAGYDGEFGSVHLFTERDRAEYAQTALFAPASVPRAHIRRRIPGARPANMRRGTPEAARPATPGVDAPEGRPNSQRHPRRLNAAQWSAVSSDCHRLLIVAGPGTGKTHTLTWRIARLLETIDKEQRVLAITFTNRAAEEMQERVHARCPAAAGRAEIGTFHRFCLRLLRMHAVDAGLPADFGVADERQCRRAARSAWPDFSSAEIEQCLRDISLWKAGVLEQMPEEAHSYAAALRKIGLIDFDDLLAEALRLLEGNPAIARGVSDSVRHIFVDEYQDVNPAQVRLLQALASAGAGLTAIGDRNQAIYGFRGADVELFHRFAEYFPGAVVMHLADNYRSAPRLVRAAGQVIAAGDADAPELIARISGPGALVMHEAASERAEAAWIVACIERLLGGASMFSYDSGRVDSHARASWSFADIAILYRLHAQSAALAEALDRAGLPYQTAGKRPLGAHALTRAIVALLHMAHGRPVAPGDCVETGLLFEEAIREEHETGSVCSEAARAGAEAICRAVPGLNEKHEAVGAELTVMLDAARQGPARLCAALAARAWHDRHVRSWPDGRDIWRRLEQVARWAHDADDFLDAIALRAVEESVDRRCERIALMTAHAAKGLEFPVVFIAGCEDGLFPLDCAGMQSPVDEERRLFYVAMTRAKSALHLSRARRRSLFGVRRDMPASRFLNDIEKRLVRIERARHRAARAPGIDSEQLSLFD